MKTILAPVDFSETSVNAANYAAELAKLTRSKLILLNSFNVPVPVTEAPVVMVSADELENASLERLNALSAIIKTSVDPSLDIECISRAGFASEEIKDTATEKNADLIVMGIKGVGTVSEFLIGSTTTDMMKKCSVPVMSIPENCSFTIPEKIVFAYDHTEIHNKGALSPLLELNKLFGSELLVLNIFKELEVASVSKAVSGIKMEHILEGSKHQFSYFESEDVTKGINSFVEEKKAGMVAMIPRKHSFFHNLLHEGNTKKEAFHSRVPLIAIPDFEG